MKSKLLIPFLLVCCTAMSQQKITTGTPINDLFIPHLINSSVKSMRLSDYFDRLLIIDFWATNCSGCVAQLPKLSILQKKFGNKLAVLPVTYEDEQRVSAFFKKNKYVQGVDLPLVVEDKNLAAAFKHLSIPHEVWIYKGKLVAVTASDYVTAGNIQFILDGHQNNWQVKNDFLLPVDTAKAFLQIDPAQYADAGGRLQYAAVFGYRENPGLGRIEGTTYDTVRHTRRDFFINKTILSAYLDYWSELSDSSANRVYPINLPASRVVLEVKDPSIDPFKKGEYMDVWHRQHLICYESVSPDTPQTSRQRARRIIADLDHLLGLHGRYEVRRQSCWLLVKTGTTSRVHPNNAGENGYQITTESITYVMNQQPGNKPVFNETGDTTPIYLDTPITSWTDLDALRSILQPYGIGIREEERDVQLFILTDKAP